MLVLVLLVGTPLWLRSWGVQDGDFHGRTGALWLGWIALGALFVPIRALLATTPPTAIKIPSTMSCLIIVGSCALFQLFACSSAMSRRLSTDAYRYRTEGAMWLVKMSPYAHSPASYVRSGRTYRNVDDALDHEVSHPSLPSIYPPIAQASFVLGRWFEPWLGKRSFLWNDPFLTFRVMYSVVAVACVAILVGILRSAGNSVWWAMLFAWNPLTVIETGAAAHVDILGVMFLLACMWMLQRRRFVWAAVCLALATGAKPQAAMLLPWMLRDAWMASADQRSRRRAVWWSLGAFAVVLALDYVPPLCYQNGYRGFLATVREYSSSWEFNGSVYELIKARFGQGDKGLAMERAKASARLLAQAALVLTALVLWRRRASMIEAGYWLYLIALLFSPVVYPWYLLWMLCLIPLLRGNQGWTGLVWCATVGVSYVVWHEPQWVVPRWAALIEYVPVFVVLAIELAFVLRRHGLMYSTNSPIFVNPN
jgi:hypothetical protein